MMLEEKLIQYDFTAAQASRQVLGFCATSRPMCHLVHLHMNKFVTSLPQFSDSAIYVMCRNGESCRRRVPYSIYFMKQIVDLFS